MKKMTAVFITVLFLLCLLGGSASAKWSLLEDFEMADLAGDEGLCFAVVHDECDFEVKKYGQTYPEDELKDDMDDTRDRGYEMIDYDYSFKHPRDPFPTPEADNTPVPGEPFFESARYMPGYSGWIDLWEKVLKAMPAP